MGVKEDLDAMADPERATHAQRYFKTGPGEYGEGDIFIGLRMGDIHSTVRQHRMATREEIEGLLESEIHEHRMAGLLILVERYRRADKEEQKDIYSYYLSRTERINNWDLVDCSAHKIVGLYLLDRPHKPLFRLARSKNLWERRIAIISTFAFIRKDHYATALEIAELLLTDREDLIHKGVGWMLREIGNRDQAVLEAFLELHSKSMPRTMLRYAIERLDDQLRAHYMKR